MGDLFFFGFALWLSLTLRTFEMPSQELFLAHLSPFAVLFAGWVVVFFIAGLYESRSIILARRAFSVALLVAQTFNIAVAAIFFFLTPSFGIAPKTLLLIYLFVSFFLVLVWRVFLYPRLGLQKPEAAVVVGDSVEVRELVTALRLAPHAPARIVAVVVPNGEPVFDAVTDAIEAHQARIVIADFNDQRVRAAFSELYNYVFRGVRFFDSSALYEEVFGRVPLSLVDEQWVARHISRQGHMLYDPLKRMMDIVVALCAGVVSLVLYPFLALATKIQDGGAIFYRQLRTGENNKTFVMSKFRSMSGTDQGGEVLKSKLVVTPVGRVLRKTRLDEIPQLWSVVVGDMSLIGPRPEFPALVEEYARAIPYYNLRHLVKPGLSGWAQLYHDNHPHHGTEVEATREKLSYDLYYLKHRSLVLDATIVLKTIKKLLSRSGV